MLSDLDMKTSQCQRFLEELEGLAATAEGKVKPQSVLTQMSREARGHAQLCAECSGAVGDLIETRMALLPLREPVAEAGPWFAARVMAAIRAKESELEERSNGVWLSVRRLAPRLVALCAVVLLVGTTWAYQVRRQDLAQQSELRSQESVFENVPTPMNDDVLVGGQGDRP